MANVLEYIVISFLISSKDLFGLSQVIKCRIQLFKRIKIFHLLAICLGNWNPASWNMHFCGLVKTIANVKPGVFRQIKQTIETAYKISFFIGWSGLEPKTGTLKTINIQHNHFPFHIIWWWFNCSFLVLWEALCVCCLFSMVLRIYYVL